VTEHNHILSFILIILFYIITKTIWFLFILGLVLVVLDGIVFPIIGKNTMTDAYFATGLGIASLILSIVAMKIRQKLE